MEVAVYPSSTFKTPRFSFIKFSKTPLQTCNFFLLPIQLKPQISTIYSPIITEVASAAPTPSTFSPPSSTTSGQNRHWIVFMETPPHVVNSWPQVINYYAKTLQAVLGSEKDAQKCIYDASWNTPFGFCCDIDEETSRELVRLPGVLSVRPDPDSSSSEKDYRIPEVQLGLSSNTLAGSTLLFPLGNSKPWVVRVGKPGGQVASKAQIVYYYARLLTKVMGNQKDAQMCIYHISRQYNYGFCCELDEECARELAGLPPVLSVCPDNNYDSDNKDYGGENSQQLFSIKTKKLFVTGLSFYTSEKTLRAAFEGFGELAEVKIIMDNISKRSKGYAFVKYTTKKAAAAALKEMNGKIINGWMITVEAANEKNPPKNSRRPEGVYNESL